MDKPDLKAKGTPAGNPPGDLYYEQKQESSRTEPCRLKRTNLAKAGFWKLFRRAALTAGLMFIMMFAAAKLVKLASRAKPAGATIPATVSNAPVSFAKEPAGIPNTELRPDPEVIQKAVLAAREGEALSRSGSWSDAAGMYSRALDFWPGYAAAQAGLGHALLIQGHVAEAESFLGKAIAADPDNAPVLNSLGLIEMIRKNPDRAAVFFEAAAALDPGDIESRLNLARSDFALGYVDRAKKHTRNALEIDPQNAEALRYLSYLEAAVGNFDESIRLLTDAIHQAPDMLSLYIDAAATCALMGNSAKAVDYLRKGAHLDSAEKIRLVFGEPVFLHARESPEGRQLENELVKMVGEQKEAGNPTRKDADSPAGELLEGAGKK